MLWIECDFWGHTRHSVPAAAQQHTHIHSEDPARGPRYERPDALKALLLSYILAVAVVADEGVLDKEQFEELRAALKVPRNRGVRFKRW